MYDFYVHYLINFVVYSRLTLGEISGSIFRAVNPELLNMYIKGDHFSYLDSVHP